MFPNPKSGTIASTTMMERKRSSQREVAWPLKKCRYRQRNKIERMFCRLNDARRIATRYDKSAKTYLNAICLISIAYWWLN
ncbi:MAG: hypothetical protein NTAFB01_05130 [Nitrospira sp.]